MTALSQTGLWAIAATGSIAFHLAVGMVLYAMPMPEGASTVRTEINIAAVPTGDTEPAVAESVASVATEDAAVSARPSKVAALEAARIASEAAAIPDTLDARPAGSTGEAIAIGAETAPPREAADTLEPAVASEAADAAQARDALDAVSATAGAQAVASSEAASITPSEAAPVSAATASSAEAQAAPDLEAAQIASGELSATVRPEAPVAVPSVQTSEPSDSTLSAETEAIASIESETPLIATGGEIAAPTGGAPSAAAARAPGISVQAVAPRADAAASTARPAASAAQPLTATALAPSAAPVREDLEPAVAPRAADGSAAAAALSGLASPAETETTELAALPRPLAVPEPSPPEQPRMPRIGIGDFLAANKGEDCMLALPAAEAEATQPFVEAYAREPRLVGELEAAYEQASGAKLDADVRPVSAAQCVALAFARDLAQYPNFPLHLMLSEQAIRSGDPLSGVIAGLRKDTLYLIVIDDEGKAELVTSFGDQSSSLMTFRAPMTLTSGPVSSVQLLVAIASDGPLRTVPVKPGIPAEEFFSRLATEIIASNRPIAFGITSFRVKE